MKTKTLPIHCNYTKNCLRRSCLNFIHWAMLLLGQLYGFVELTLSESFNIVKTFKHNYMIKMFLVWES